MNEKTLLEAIDNSIVPIIDHTNAILGWAEEHLREMLGVYGLALSDFGDNLGYLQQDITHAETYQRVNMNYRDEKGENQHDTSHDVLLMQSLASANIEITKTQEYRAEQITKPYTAFLQERDVVASLASFAVQEAASEHFLPSLQEIVKTFGGTDVRYFTHHLTVDPGAGGHADELIQGTLAVQKQLQIPDSSIYKGINAGVVFLLGALGYRNS